MRHRSIRSFILLTVPIVCCALFYSSGQSALAPSLKIPGKAKTPGTMPLEDDLFKRLLGDEPQEQETDENPLENAIKGMLDAEKRIGNKNIGDETQNIQKKVVDDLQKLIDLANQRQQQQLQRRQQNSRRQRNQQQNGPRQQGSGNQKKQSSSSQQNASDQQNRKQPGDSGAGARVGETNSAELLRQRRLLEEVWGHLPPAMRERMQNVISEKYLPKYDEMIRRYFKSLAEDEKSPRRK